MNVLLTGGTGFVGRAILRELAACGQQARLLVRHPAAARAKLASLRGGREFCPGDVLRASSLPAALAGVDAVIHLVGIISEVGRQTYENVHTRGTENLVAAARTAGVRRFLHMSALGTRPNAVARYHQSKWVAEECVRGSGLDWTIFRPSIIYGPGDGFVNLFARMARWSPILPVMGGGKNLMQPVAVEDVARCFVGALINEPGNRGASHAGEGLSLHSPHPDPLPKEREQATSATVIDTAQQPASTLHPILPLPTGEGRGEGNGGVVCPDDAGSVHRTFDLCGDERFTLEEILDAILAISGRRRLKLRIPLPLARLQAAACEFVFPKLLGKAPPLNRDQLAMLQEDNVGDPEPAKQVFGFTPVKFQEGISAFLARR